MIILYIGGWMILLVNKIMLNGRGGAGKDIFADYLVDNYGFKKIAFADGIYEIAYKYFGMTIKDRDLLQKIGEKMREIDPLVWVNVLSMRQNIMIK